MKFIFIAALLIQILACPKGSIEARMYLHPKTPFSISDSLEQYNEPVIFHCYWTGQLNEKHLISIRSCHYFNIKEKNKNKIILWIENNIPSIFDEEIEKYAEIRPFNLTDELKFTFLENQTFRYNKNPSYYSDVVRKVLLYKYGGCWFDLDIFFLRDFTPLFTQFENEICVYRWANTNCPNGAIYISLKPFNENLKNIIQFIINRNRGWGFQEARLTYSLPLKYVVLPCEWFDAIFLDNTLRTVFFESSDKIYRLEEFFCGAFCYHWHNLWDKPIEPTSPIRQLYNQIIFNSSNM